ncbi:response regulator transcription factor [Enterococcus raffinosus]|uniref:response regulator transcription factor n=1 Tax=Enterococcus raffinosus TaxID=71452 RepID=UPI001C11CBEA|nr:response regulator transcription factor [Enterococcus raffinosus]MBU5360083.1 response regulator transcription factor [Enterococcus raffinosus]
MGFSILIADDEQGIIDFVTLYLEKDGYTVFTATDGENAWACIQQEKIDLAILDIMMPKMNGYQLIKKIRTEKNMPIIFLTAKDASADKVLGLDIGADDYVTKPFDPLELVARVSAQLRRFYSLGSQEINIPEKIELHDLILDLEQCLLFKGNEQIALTSIEFKILRLLMSSPGRVFTKKQIYEAVWEDTYIVDDNNIMVYISRLREKLGTREEESYIQTIRGLGYKILP